MRSVRILAASFLMLLLLAGLTACGQPAATADEDCVSIQVDGREVRRIPLSKPQTVTIDQGGGVVNVIEITERGAVMKSSTCENQLCVHMGEVNVDNWEYRPNGAFIICLPHRVTVELKVKE
ncbi:MAG: NusG domain II-containing protein [Clostridia bacterium]|nr:NusG domain II-containing protein [Clostridia bacterium]